MVHILFYCQLAVSEVGPLTILQQGLQQGQQSSPGGGLLPIPQQPVDYHVPAAALWVTLAVLIDSWDPMSSKFRWTPNDFHSVGPGT